jgi:CRP/FNR family cyclic AMP-dependent transcriptional regulator
VDFDAVATMTAEQRELLLEVASSRTFRRRDTLFHAGDPADSIFVIRSGHVAIRIVTEHGDNVTLAVLGPGDVFGELALLSPDNRRSATATALEETATSTLTRAQLSRPRGDPHAVEALLIHLLSNQVHRLTGQLVDALYVPVRHRVARVLLDLCPQYDQGSPRVTMLVTQDDIAGLTGAGRPTVNQVLRALEDAGAIELRRGRIDVIDRAELARHRG